MALQHAKDEHLANCQWLDSPCLQTLDPEEDMAHRSTSQTSMRRQPTVKATDSKVLWAEPSQTLIFLDWDDTLFPTTDLFDNWGLPSRPEQWGDIQLTKAQEKALERWRSTLFVYLRTACALSNRCAIVTNAMSGWVSSCIDHFAPNLRELFRRGDGPKVIYARDVQQSRGSIAESPGFTPARYPDKAPSDLELTSQMTKAKFNAMWREAKAFYSQYPNQSWKNILSVGDARYEHDAALELAFRRKSPDAERLRVKAVTTPEQPRLIDLTYRLKLATLLWPGYVKFDGDLDIDMNSHEQLQTVANALDMPELFSIIRAMPIRDKDEEALNAEMDEVAIIVHSHYLAE